jgi:hypothetical protein
MIDTKSKDTVPMDSSAVRQKHRLAAGMDCNGQTLPSAPSTGLKTPA